MVGGGGIHLATVNIVKKTLRTLCSENTTAQTRDKQGLPQIWNVLIRPVLLVPLHG